MSRTSNVSPPQGKGSAKAAMTLGGGPDQPRELGHLLQDWPGGQVRAQAAHPLDGAGDLTRLRFQAGLVRGQRRLPGPCVSPPSTLATCAKDRAPSARRAAISPARAISAGP